MPKIDISEGVHDAFGNLYKRDFYSTGERLQLRQLSERSAQLRALLRAARSEPSNFPEARKRLIEDTETALATVNAEIDFLKMGVCA